ncbi:plasmid replication protein RepC [Cereibacter sp. SYSU M97828]|nr:plasmid replication protein RepC [Cereibacter flavus]
MATVSPREKMMQQQIFTSPAPRGGSQQHTRATTKNELWSVLRSIVKARHILGLKQPPLTTLRALLSFVQDTDRLTVFASNKELCMRAEGTNERTLRRHLAKLADAGLIRRLDSSNGKRFTISQPGGERIDYGLDLSPLYARRHELHSAAAEADEEAELIKFYRRKLSGLVYSCERHGVDHELGNDTRAIARRVSGSTALKQLCERLVKLLEQTLIDEEKLNEPAVEPNAKTDMTDEMSANASHIVRHIDKTRIINIDSKEGISEKGMASDDDLSLAQLMASSPAAMAYLTDYPKDWRTMEDACFRLAKWAGISTTVTAAAVEKTGRRHVATLICGIFERLDAIRNPGAYFASMITRSHSTPPKRPRRRHIH